MSVQEVPPWNDGMRGEQVRPLIEADAPAIRVSAGPGTGKTFGLARRVVRLLHPEGAGLEGNDVLVVAFNRVIAADLSRNIGTELARSGYRGEMPVVRTIHALCLASLGNDAPRLLLPDEVDCMLYDVQTDHTAIRSAYPSFHDLSQALREYEANRESHPALRQGVERWLTRHGAMLVSDLPERLRLHLDTGDREGARYQSVVVDEFQDLTPGEQALVTQLVRSDGSLVALGDPRQSIYNFRGNDRDGLDRLEELTNESVLDVPMTECQRCPREVVEAANIAVALYGHTPMIPASDKPSNIHTVHWKTPEAEAKGMASAIQENMAAFPSERHLVMATRRKWAYALRDEIKALDPGIPIEITFSEGILEAWPVREAFYFFCLLADPDPATWRAWLSYQEPDRQGTYQAPRRSADAYLRFLGSTAEPVTDARVRSLARERRAAQRGAGGTRIWDRAARYVSLADQRDWNALSTPDLIEAVFNPGLWDIPSSPEFESVRGDLDLLRGQARQSLDEIATSTSTAAPEAFTAHVAKALRYQIATRKPFDDADSEQDRRLTITTLWGAKGLTADHVYVIGMCNEAMPGTRPPSYRGSDEDHYDEQRRLFYVTLTRSTRTLVLSRPQKVRNGDVRRLRLSDCPPAGPYHRRLTATAFVRDIPTMRGSVDGETWDGCVAYLTKD